MFIVQLSNFITLKLTKAFNFIINFELPKKNLFVKTENNPSDIEFIVLVKAKLHKKKTLRWQDDIIRIFTPHVMIFNPILFSETADEEEGKKAGEGVEEGDVKAGVYIMHDDHSPPPLSRPLISFSPQQI